jgi:hypothetical protein
VFFNTTRHRLFGQTAFGFGSYPPVKMPSDIFFQLYGIAPLGIGYEHRPVDCTTEKGFQIWINRATISHCHSLISLCLNGNPKDG